MLSKWKSVLDDQACDECRTLHGRVLWPGDLRPPLHDGSSDSVVSCRCVLEPAKVLAVGERFNYHKWWRPAIFEHEYSLDLRLRMGFYNRPTGRRKFLNELGIEWTDGINLLWPSPVCGYWNEQEAFKVAQTLRPEIEKRWDVVLLFGKRVCEAFEVEYVPLRRLETYLPLPHPSGRCRTWNDCKFLGRVRRFFK